MCVAKRKTSPHLLALLIVPLLLMLVVFISFNGTKSHSSVVDLVPLQDSSSTLSTRPVDQPPLPITSNAVQISKQLNNADILEVCPDPSAEVLTETCWGYLDRLLSEKPRVNEDLHWIQFSEEMTLRRIFEDPSRERQRVLETLKNPECILSDSSDIRWDLYDTCHASAFTYLKHFELKCSSPRSYSLRISRWFFPSYEQQNGKWISKFDWRLGVIESYPANETKLRTQELWEEILEDRWIVRQCEKFDFEHIWIDPKRDVELMSQLEDVGTKLGVSWKDYEDLYLGTLIDRTLTALAARFGHMPAIFTYGGSSKWYQYRDEKHPWILTNYAIFANDASRQDKLLNGVHTVIGLEDSDLEFNLDDLVNHLCTNQSQPDPENCQTTIENLRSSLAPTEWRIQQLLDRIERIALDQGIYFDTETDGAIQID